MRLELKSKRALPVREILNCLERRLAKMNITELQFANFYCLQGINEHIQFVPAKCDKLPFDPASVDDSDSPSVQSFEKE